MTTKSYGSKQLNNPRRPITTRLLQKKNMIVFPPFLNTQYSQIPIYQEGPSGWKRVVQYIPLEVLRGDLHRSHFNEYSGGALRQSYTCIFSEVLLDSVENLKPHFHYFYLRRTSTATVVSFLSPEVTPWFGRPGTPLVDPISVGPSGDGMFPTDESDPLWLLWFVTHVRTTLSSTPRRGVPVRSSVTDPDIPSRTPPVLPGSLRERVFYGRKHIVGVD